MPARLIESLATTGPLAELFSDTSVLQAMLDFESALARAEARTGVVPQAAAEAISAAAKTEGFDPAALAEATLRAGTPGIPLVKALTERVRVVNPEAARFVHWGTTSQDVADTAMVLLLKRARAILAGDLSRLETALHEASERHRNTVMLGRTLLQAAPPDNVRTEGCGMARSGAAEQNSLEYSVRRRLRSAIRRRQRHLASLGKDGLAAAEALAAELKLKLPAAPWHTHRDRLAGLVCACGVLTGTLGKMARDISLLMQSEVQEAAEPGGAGRGGSSTMPQKRNPIACALTLASAQRVPGQVSAFLSAMVQEHERGIGGWQAEWPILAGVVQSTGLAMASMAEVAEGLSVDEARMRENIAQNQGRDFCRARHDAAGICSWP